MRVTLLVFLVAFVSTVQCITFTEKVEIGPRWCKYRTFSDINHFSFEAYDIKNTGVTVYLNKGNLTEFNPENTLIHCNDVKTCKVKNLRLDTGIYTLFIYNDHHFMKQRVEYEVSYWRLETEITLFVIVFLIFFTCFSVTVSLYFACVRKR